MIQVDLESNTRVRQQFATNYLALSNRIIALRARNEQISARLILLMEKGKAFRKRWTLD
ncbi:hypothetical protein [Spirosoma migulaei]